MNGSLKTSFRHLKRFKWNVSKMLFAVQYFNELLVRDNRLPKLFACWKSYNYVKNVCFKKQIFAFFSEIFCFFEWKNSWRDN